MGVISFSGLPEEEIFEIYDEKGFITIVQKLTEFTGNHTEQLLSVFVAVEKQDVHELVWHEVPGVTVSPAHSAQQLSSTWNRVHAHMRQQHKPTLTLVRNEPQTR